ncbi:MAG TPA: hypothetical protein VH643_04565 [Gemmataceae bacterium]|jgi:hypothetical protein
MRRQRTTPILVIAILHLVGGGLGLILSLCGCGGLVMTNALSSAIPTVPQRPGQPPPPPSAADTMKYYNDHIPGYRAFTFGGLALSLMLDIMLLAAGIGLLNVQPWARWLSLVYAPISILNRLVSFVYQLVWVLPVTQELYAKNPAMAGMSSFVTIGGGIGLVVSLLFILYPIAVVVLMLLPSTAAAFRGELPSREDDYGEDDREEGDPWREPPPRSDKFRL